MLRFLNLICLLLLLNAEALFSQTPDPQKPVEPGGVGADSAMMPECSVNEVYTLMPAPVEGELILRRTGYSVSFNCTHKLANWVSYVLTAEETNSKVKRKNLFAADTMAKSCLVVPDDYKRSGYDKGHLAPSADMCWSLLSMRESFYMTNMAPQKPRFNRGMWKRLEDQVRDWAVENDSVLVVTGPVLKAGLPQLDRNSISIPEAFYKVILGQNGPGLKVMAFVMDNKRLTGELSEYAVSVDSVENLTGLDLFSDMPDDTESLIESTVNLQGWLWNGKAIRMEEDDEEE